jgi:hypothetical protein
VTDQPIHDTQSPIDPPIEAITTEDAEFTNIEDLFNYFAYTTTKDRPSEHTLPRTIPEALSGDNAAEWAASIERELKGFRDNDVYDEVPIPEGVKPLPSKPVFKVKHNHLGEISDWKTRLVILGFLQRLGIDYDETFAPVANIESIRIIIALAAKYNLELEGCDITQAYLNGELEEDIYVMPPEGVEIKEGYCWKLKKSVYGLKQAGRTWNRTLDRRLTGMGFTRLDAETCLYVSRDDKGHVCFLVVYVDDIILATNFKPYSDEIKRKLGNEFKMRDLGSLKWVLGIEIDRDRKAGTIDLSQRLHLSNALKRFGMADCNPIRSQPIQPGHKLSANDPNDTTIIPEMIINGTPVKYISVVGSLMYAAICTRPDLSYAVSLLGRYAAKPQACHWEALKRVLRYVKGTLDMVLRYDGSGPVSTDFEFHGYTDADWSGDSDTSRSTSGFVFISANGAIAWSSKLQTMVALSSTESEYIGLCNAGQHLSWLRLFFEDIGHAQKKPTELNCDNQAAIILTKEPQFRARTKHIQRKYHYVRDDIVASGKAFVRYVPTADMVADIFTKALPTDKHWKFVHAMGLRFRASRGVKG